MKLFESKRTERAKSLVFQKDERRRSRSCFYMEFLISNPQSSLIFCKNLLQYRHIHDSIGAYSFQHSSARAAVLTDNKYWCIHLFTASNSRISSGFFYALLAQSSVVRCPMRFVGLIYAVKLIICGRENNFVLHEVR